MQLLEPLSKDFFRKRSLRRVALSETLSSQQRTSFELYPGRSPKDFVSSHCSPGTYEDNGKRVKFDKGTTTLAFRFKEGVIVSVDSRASQGSYVSSQTVEKVIPITDNLLGTMAGGAADCLFWQRNLGMKVHLHELRNKETCSVAAASKMLANTMNYYKGSGLSMGTMVTGKDNTGAQLYYVDNDGTRLKATRSQPYFCVGSGSTYAYGIMDTEYKWNMTLDEAIALGRKAIYHATHRDGASGGMNNVFVVENNKNKWNKLEPIDVNTLHDKFQAERANKMQIG